MALDRRNEFAKWREAWLVENQNYQEPSTCTWRTTQNEGIYLLNSECAFFNGGRVFLNAANLCPKIASPGPLKASKTHSRYWKWPNFERKQLFGDWSRFWVVDFVLNLFLYFHRMYKTDNGKCLEANTFKTLMMLVLNFCREHLEIK